MEFSRQEYWSGLPFPSLWIFLTQGLNPVLLHSRQILYCLSQQGRHTIEKCLKALDYTVTSAGLLLAAVTTAATAAVDDTRFHHLRVSDCRQNQYSENLHEVTQWRFLSVGGKARNMYNHFFYFCYKTAFFCSYCFLVEGRWYSSVSLFLILILVHKWQYSWNWIL